MSRAATPNRVSLPTHRRQVEALRRRRRAIAHSAINFITRGLAGISERADPLAPPPIDFVAAGLALPDDGGDDDDGED